MMRAAWIVSATIGAGACTALLYPHDYIKLAATPFTLQGGTNDIPFRVPHEANRSLEALYVQISPRQTVAADGTISIDGKRVVSLEVQALTTDGRAYSLPRSADAWIGDEYQGTYAMFWSNDLPRPITVTGVHIWASDETTVTSLLWLSSTSK